MFVLYMQYMLKHSLCKDEGVIALHEKLDNFLTTFSNIEKSLSL